MIPWEKSGAVESKKEAGESKGTGHWPLRVLVAAALFLILDCGLTPLARPLLSPLRGRTYRMKSSAFHHGLRPFADTFDAWGPLAYSVRTNSLGLRDAEARTILLKPSGRRVLFIGDSFTEGPGYGYDRTFVGLIGRRLAPRGVEVLNAGVTSYHPGIYLRKVRHLLDGVGLGFEELVVYIDISDIQDETEYEEKVDGSGRRVLRGKNDGPLDEYAILLKIRDFVADRTTLLDLAANRLRRLGPGYRLAAGLSALGRARALWTLDEGLWKDYGEAGLMRAARHMDELGRLLKSRGIRLTVAVYPWPDQIARRDLPSKHEIFWRDWARLHGARFIDYFPRFMEYPADETLRAFFIPGDVHWNAAGHRLVADGFMESFDQRR